MITYHSAYEFDWFSSDKYLNHNLNSIRLRLVYALLRLSSIVSENLDQHPTR